MVQQRSPFAWVGFGDYLGNRIEVQDRTVTYVLERWRDAAAGGDGTGI